MAHIYVVVPHKLSEDVATGRIKKLLGSVKNEYSDKITDLKESWRGNKGTFSFSAMGFKASGTVDVSDSNVEITGILPLLATPFKAKIQSVIEREAKKLLK